MTMTMERPVTEEAVQAHQPEAPVRPAPTLNATMTRKGLLAALALPVKTTGTATSFRALRHLLLTMDGARLRVQGTDLEVEAESGCEAQGSGVALVPGRTFHETISALPEGEVTLRAVEMRLEVQCGNSRFLVPTDNQEDFAGGFAVEGESWEVPGSELGPLLKAVALAASDDATRTNICSVWLRMGDEGVIVAATDTHRVHEGRLPHLAGEAYAANIPTRTVQLILSGLDPDRCWELCGDGNQLRISDGETTLVSRLIDQQFPSSYSRCIPPKGEEKAVWAVSGSDLGGAIRRLQLVARDCAAVGRVIFESDEDTVALNAENGEGRADDRISAVVAGAPMRLALQSTYARAALEAFAALGVDRISLRLTAPLNPLLIEAAEGECPLRVVLMPMQII